MQLGVCGRLFFFFQAEDGIRVYKVTGVQTCALPIYFGGETVVGEYQGLLTATDQLNRKPPRLVDVTAADAQMPVDHRWVVENEVLLARRRAVAVNQRERLFRKRFG